MIRKYLIKINYKNGEARYLTNYNTYQSFIDYDCAFDSKEEAEKYKKRYLSDNEYYIIEGISTVKIMCLEIKDIDK